MEHKHPYKIYTSKPEDIDILKQLPAGALKGAVFYDGVEKRKWDMHSQKGLVITLASPQLVNQVARNLMAYVHLSYENGRSYIIRESVFDEKKHQEGIPPASVFLVSRDNQRKGHYHLFEIESLSKGGRFQLQSKLGLVEILVHAPRHHSGESGSERLDNVLKQYAKFALDEAPKAPKVENPIWWLFPNIPYRSCLES